ncbi:Uncharacterized HTH-type transcriptional regulator ypdC [uncultured Ruminococcus sp.]|nr:Uncharacterized HTH-type transcriptional regulator ypdC [uncultured Clostridium sp.]SCH96221.1 Uncharacterized HTH-type transcriptional regulator ypdC [uncultured Ruminococcus sp.]
MRVPHFVFKSTKKSYSKRVFVSFVLIATICTSLCGGILSCYFLTKLSWNNEQYNFNTIQYTQTEIQQIIDNIVVSAYQMGLDPLVEKYLRPYNQVDYLEIGNISRSVYNTYSSLSDYVDSIYVVYPYHNMVISSYGIYAWDTFNDRVWYEDSPPSQSIRWVGEHTVKRTGNLSDMESEPVITAVYQLPFYAASRPNGYIVMNIRQPALEEILLKAVFQKSHLLVTSSDYQLLASSNSLDLSDYYDQYISICKKTLPEDGKQKIHLDSGIHRVQMLKDPVNQWNYFVFSPLGDLYQTTLWGICIVACTLLFTICLAVVLSSRFRTFIYRPVEQLMKKASGEDIQKGELVEYQEFKTIHGHFDDIESENKELQHKMQELAPYLQEKFFSDLLTGQLIGPGQIRERLSFLRLDQLPYQRYVVSVIKILETDTSMFEIKQSRNEIQLLVMMAMQEQMRQLCGQEKIFFRDVGVNQESLEFIFGFSEGQYSTGKLTELHRLLAEYSKQALDTSIIVGIGHSVKEISSLQISFQQAQEVVEQNYVYGSDQIVFYRQVEKNTPVSYLNPLSYEKTLSAAMKNDNREEIVQILEDMYHMVEQSHYNIRMIRQFYIGIMNMVFLLGHEGEDGESLSASFYEITGNIYCASQLQEIHQFVLELCCKTAHRFEQQRNIKSRKLAQNIAEYLQTHFSMDLSLDQIAEEFSYTSPYINKILKIYSNTTFYDMLTEIRMKNAKQMLEDTNMQIYQISEAVGYNNTQSFIRMFKKTVGMTPGKYRQQAQDQ